jgi:hypothetical protein
VPQSCCVEYQKSSNNSLIYCTAQSLTTPDDYFNEGCYLKLKKFITINLTYTLLSLCSFALLHFLELLSVIVLIDIKIKLIRNSIHPPYVNIEAEYENATETRRQQDSPPQSI